MKREWIILYILYLCGPLLQNWGPMIICYVRNCYSALGGDLGDELNVPNLDLSSKPVGMEILYRLSLPGLRSHPI